MLHIFSYQLPFKKPFKTAGETFSHREGLILEYSENGIEAFGEVAPLPGFSEETIDQVREVLIMNREHLEQALRDEGATEFIALLEKIHQFPSLSFGLDTLYHDLQAKRKGVSLPAFLFNTYSKTIRTNAVIAIQQKEKSLIQANKLIDEGYTTIKLKVGRNFEQEVEILKALRSQFPELSIRIDANEAWSTDEAIRNLSTLESLDIEYCEQPVEAADLQGLKKVTDTVNINVAADESVRNKNAVEELLANKAADLLIIKPALMGTFKNIFVTKQLADTHNIEVVFTTAMESAVGRSAILALTSGLASQSRAQGLSTGSLLNDDITQDKWLDGSTIEIPEKPGLGITVQTNKIKELT
ncbi:MAG: o-succinylbenzoate synthase [Balneola sp.]|mgnify:FL=1|nr:o-succinylbenzoate synthase [Balneola sp.]|tara:strand:+ start:242798 stop:243868 length:1071 start_codon:yes stop_codon:yes gene_type:complete